MSSLLHTTRPLNPIKYTVLSYSPSRDDNAIKGYITLQLHFPLTHYHSCLVMNPCLFHSRSASLAPLASSLTFPSQTYDVFKCIMPKFVSVSLLFSLLLRSCQSSTLLSPCQISERGGKHTSCGNFAVGRERRTKTR